GASTTVVGHFAQRSGVDRIAAALAPRATLWRWQGLRRRRKRPAAATARRERRRTRNRPAPLQPRLLWRASLGGDPAVDTDGIDKRVGLPDHLFQISKRRFAARVVTVRKQDQRL